MIIFYKVWINNPLLNFGSNHVDFGGIILPSSAIAISSFTDVGYIANATSPEVVARKSQLSVSVIGERLEVEVWRPMGQEPCLIYLFHERTSNSKSRISFQIPTSGSLPMRYLRYSVDTNSTVHHPISRGSSGAV